MAVILKRSFCILIGLQSVSLSAAGTKGNGGKIVVGAEKVSELEDHETRHYTGQVVSKATVNIVARVSGEILEIGFRDGEFVRAGQMLCKRDPVQYEAAVKGAEAEVVKCKAELAYAQSNFDRINLLYRKAGVQFGHHLRKKRRSNASQINMALPDRERKLMAGETLSVKLLCKNGKLLPAVSASALMFDANGSWSPRNSSGSKKAGKRENVVAEGVHKVLPVRLLPISGKRSEGCFQEFSWNGRTWQWPSAWFLC